MPFESKMICPACKKPTRRTRSQQCVHCRVTLEVFTYRKDGESLREFRLPKPEEAVEVIQKTEASATIVDAEGRMLTPEGSNPEIILISQKPKRYKVTYRQDIPTNWVYCPDCGWRMFQNMVMNSVHLEQEYNCSRCHAEVVFVFLTGFSPYYSTSR